MRKLFVVALLALLLGVGVVALIETDPGYVLVSYRNYTLETSLWVGLSLLVLLVVSIGLLLKLVYRVIRGRRSLSSWLGNRKARNAQRLSTRGMISYAEGNWAAARRQLLRGARNNEAPLANYLLAAQSSAHLRDDDKVHEYLRAAGDAEPGAAVAIEVALAEMKLEAGEHQQALEALDQATRNIGKHPHVLTLLSRAYQGLEDWDKLAELLPQLQKHKLPSTAEFQKLERQVHRNRLERGGTGTQQLHVLWQSLPRYLQRDPEMVDLYVGKLIAAGDHGSADKMIQRTLKQVWSDSLVRQYGYVHAGNAAAQLVRAESWLVAHPENAELLLCLGRLAAREKLWGKAREYFENSYRLNPGAEVCAELGRLLTALGEPDAAAAYYREGLMQREERLPPLPLPDKSIPDHHRLASS